MTYSRIGEEMRTGRLSDIISDGFGTAVGRIGAGAVIYISDSHIDIVEAGGGNVED